MVCSFLMAEIILHQEDYFVVVEVKVFSDFCKPADIIDITER